MRRCEGKLVLKEHWLNRQSSLLKWCGHVERMEDTLVNRIVGPDVRGVRKAMYGMNGW